MKICNCRKKLLQVVENQKTLIANHPPQNQRQNLFSVQRELFYCKIKYALCAVPATVKGRSVARCPDLSSLNENLSAFLYNRKSKNVSHCVQIASASVNRKYNVELLNVKSYQNIYFINCCSFSF